MVQCNVDIEENTMDTEDLKHGFHLNPANMSHHERESDTCSMMSKHKIDLMFTIDRKNAKQVIENKGEDSLIENNVQEKIDQMFKDVALNDMLRSFYVDYLGSIQLNNDMVHSLETLQDPLKKLYISYKKEKQIRPIGKKSVLEISKNGLKLIYGSKLEQVNSFSTICVWASVKLITKPHGMNKAFGLEYCFVPLIADYNNNLKFIKLNQAESALFPKNTYHDNIPIFVVVMKKMCTTTILEAHAFICNSSDEAIHIAANLYKTLLVTSTKHRNKIKQKNGITSCMSVNDSLNGSLSKVSHVVSKENLSSRGSFRNLDKTSDADGKIFGMNRVESVIQEIENRMNSENKHESSESRLRQKPSEPRDRRSSSVESVRNFKMETRKEKSPQAVNQVESVRHYVDYVSEAVKQRRSSIISSVSSRRHRSSSVESVKDYNVRGHRTHRNNLSPQNSSELLKERIAPKKYSKSSSESLRRNLRANSVESILSYKKENDLPPELPTPRRKHSNFSMVSCNGVIENCPSLSKSPDPRRNSCDVTSALQTNSNFEFYPVNPGPRFRRSCSNSTNTSRNSINYLHVSSRSVNSMTQFDTRDLNLPKRTSRRRDNVHRKDSFTNETLACKSKHRSQKSLDEINVFNDSKTGDILTKVAIPRSTSFLKTDSSSRNSLSYMVKSQPTPSENRKTSASRLGLNEIFQELKNQEGLNNLDEILDVILNTDGMSFNDLKPIYKEFIVKLALILTKDEFFHKCKAIMNKQKKRKKKFKRKKVFNRFFYSDLNSLLSCGRKKIIRKTSVYKNSFMKRKPLAKKRKPRQKVLRPKDDRNMLLNDMNTSSGYFTYSECTYDTDTCTCISAEKCYCNHHSSRGISMSPDVTQPRHNRHSPLYPTAQANTMSSTFPNCNSFQNRYSEDEHCYHCFRYKSSQPRADNASICECDAESCATSDKCYCNVKVNMIDMLKMQGFAASDTSIDSFRTDYPTANNWKNALLKKPGKEKVYIQPSKSLEFVQFYGTKEDFNPLDSQDDPSSSSFSYKEGGDSSESSALDYNLFHKAKSKEKKAHRKSSQDSQSKFLVVSARDPKGRIIYMGADKKHPQQRQDAVSIKKTAEIAALFTTKQSQSSFGFQEISYHDLSGRRNVLESSLGYLP